MKTFTQLLEQDVTVAGYGKMSLDQAKRDVVQRLQDIVTVAKRGDWSGTLSLFTRGIIESELKAIIRAEDEKS